jgi:NAD(P)-dependent dehydrogenase (short-subunit alcohol dehydrogenase family)
VAITARREESVQAAVAALDGDVIGVAAHAADPDAASRCFDQVAQRWGRVDVLVNNVGVNVHFGATTAIDRRAWDKTVEVNLWAPLQWTRLALEAGLDQSGTGAVVNVSSNLAQAPGGPSGVYGMTKAALNYLTQQLAVELAPAVRVNAVAPGVVDTDMAALLVAQGEALTKQWPIPRFGVPTDIADIVEFLAGTESSWLTGQVVVIDGGARLVTSKDLLNWTGA